MNFDDMATNEIVALHQAFMAGQLTAKTKKRDLNSYARHYTARLKTAALTSFRWEGLGDHITERFLETTLLTRRMGVFYVQQPGEVPDTSFDQADVIDKPRLTFRQATSAGGFNDQWEPTVWKTIQPSGSGRTLRAGNGELEKWTCVPAYDNIMRDGYTMTAIRFHAKRLAEAAMTVDVNLFNTRTQRIALIDQEQRKTAQLVDDMVGQGQGTIFAKSSKTKSLVDAFQMLDFTVDPQIAEVNHGVFVRLFGEAYNSIGLAALDNQKEAQQTVSEIESSDGFVKSIRLARLDARRWTADKLNKRYGLEVMVKDTGTGQ